MVGLFMGKGPGPAASPPAASGANCKNHLRWMACGCAAAVLLSAGAATAQVTVNTKTGAVTNGTTGQAIDTVDRRYQQIEPTHVPLTNSELDAKTRLELIRLLQSEQGFAMRPFPRGHKGLTLTGQRQAGAGRGRLSGHGHQRRVVGQARRSGGADRRQDRALRGSIFELNGGPDPKHRFLRHIQIGVGPIN